VSWAVGLLVTVGVVAARGPGGRSVVRLAAAHPTVKDAFAAAGGRRSRWWPRRRGGRGRPDLATVAIEVAGRLRAGADPTTAWQAVLGVQLAPGAAPTMQDLAAVTPDRAQAAVVVAAGRLAVELGAPLAQLLDGVAQELAAEAEVEGERRAALAGPRATARVLTWLPVLGVVLGTAVGADPVAVLLDGGVGSAALACGVLLLWVGQLWTRRLAAAAAAAGRVS
jgi:tight adherence protein B